MVDDQDFERTVRMVVEVLDVIVSGKAAISFIVADWIFHTV